MPTVTFLVPCFNYARYLDECLDSILSQSYGDFEILILDDASTDETPTIGQRHEAADSRVSYFQHPQNIGHLNNYNFGITRAKGELIWLISADDKLASATVLERFVCAFQNDPALGYAFCRVQCIGGDSVPYDKFIPRLNYPGLEFSDSSQQPLTPVTIEGRQFFKTLLKENFVPAPSTIARKACYEQYGLFHPALTHSGDWYNWLLFSLDWRVYFEPQALVYYRKHQANMHMTYEKPCHALENALLCYQALEAYLNSQDYPADLRQQARLARVRFMKKNGFPLNLAEKALRVYHKFTDKLMRQ